MELIMIILLLVGGIGSLFTILQNISKKTDEQNQLLKEICNSLREISEKE